MNGYREFWNNLLFGSDFIATTDIERYWYSTLVFCAICFAVGVASQRARFIAPTGTLAILVAYVVALVPFMIWAASCTGCAGSAEVTRRSEELYLLHLAWGGFFAMGVATLWVAVLLSRGVAAMIDWHAARSVAHPRAAQP